MLSDCQIKGLHTQLERALHLFGRDLMVLHKKPGSVTGYSDINGVLSFSILGDLGMMQAQFSVEMFYPRTYLFGCTPSLR